MKKIAILLFTVACILIYFRPYQLSEHIGDSAAILISYSEMGVENGEPYIDMEKFNDISPNQREEIVDLLGNYSYRRMLHTFFTDGSLSGCSELLHIYIYENDELLHTITISDTDNCVLNEKTYHMKDSKQLIQEILQRNSE